jgi:hypothetical protein
MPASKDMRFRGTHLWHHCGGKIIKFKKKAVEVQRLNIKDITRKLEQYLLSRQMWKSSVKQQQGTPSKV